MRLGRVIYETGLQKESKDDARARLMPAMKQNKENFVEYLKTLGSEKELPADAAQLEAQKSKPPVISRILQMFQNAVGPTFASFPIYNKGAAADHNSGQATQFWDILSSDSRLILMRRH